MKILVCFGTRPEAIKMAPVIYELKKRRLDFKVCITAQHRKMLDQVLEFFNIKPDYDLDLMEPNQTLNELSAKVLKGIDFILEKAQPDLVLVQGDTTSALMVSLAAFHRKIKVGHIEAGLRTYDNSSPFPEEVNRQITARVADLHFAPTSRANTFLLNEQIAPERIHITGNTVVDALEWAIKKMESEPLSQNIQEIRNILDPDKRLILVTGHRRENFGEGIKNICEALLELSKLDNTEIIYPVHLNPNVQGPVQNLLGNIENIYLISPVTYPTMLWLLKSCNVIISDSGGIQEESPTFRKTVLITRNNSERMEGVESGFSILVGTDKNNIVENAIRILREPIDYKNTKNPYGDGEAARKIVEILKTHQSRNDI